MRKKWLVLGLGVAVEAAVFVACGPSDELEAPLIADCLHDCPPALSAGETSGSDAGDGAVDAADADVNTTPDVLSIVDVGVSIVDVGVSPNDVFATPSVTTESGAAKP